MKSSPYLLLIPLLALLVVVQLYPLAYAFYMSLFELSAAVPEPRFIGLGNYARLLADPLLHSSIIVSILYTALSVSASFLIGVLMAMVLLSRIRGKKILGIIYLIPLAVSPILAGILWSPPAVWDDFNSMLRFAFGLPFIDVTEPAIYFPIMIFSEAWLWSPIFMLASLAVIQQIPREVFEAATVFGASKGQLFTRIIFPALARSPAIGTIIMLKVIDTFRAFEIPFAWSFWVRETEAGAPLDTLSLYLFKLLINPVYEVPLSYMMTVSLILLIITVAASAVLLRLLKRAWVIR